VDVGYEADVYETGNSFLHGVQTRNEGLAVHHQVEDDLPEG
jgi:hypothetical protein